MLRNTKTLQLDNFLNVDLNSIKDILLKAQFHSIKRKIFDSNKSINPKVDQNYLVTSLGPKLRPRGDNGCESANQAQFANPRMTFSAITLRAGVLEISLLMVSSPSNDVKSFSRASKEAAVRYVSPKPC